MRVEKRLKKVSLSLPTPLSLENEASVLDKTFRTTGPSSVTEEGQLFETSYQEQRLCVATRGEALFSISLSSVFFPPKLAVLS